MLSFDGKSTHYFYMQYQDCIKKYAFVDANVYATCIKNSIHVVFHFAKTCLLLAYKRLTAYPFLRDTPSDPKQSKNLKVT